MLTNERSERVRNILFNTRNKFPSSKQACNILFIILTNYKITAIHTFDNNSRQYLFKSVISKCRVAWYVLQHVLSLVKHISYAVFDWLAKMIFSHVKISYFFRVFKYDFSQWPKTLYNTNVYIIKVFMLYSIVILFVYLHVCGS